MLLAIVMDVYTEVRGAIGHDSETLWSQAIEICKRFRAQYRGEQLSMTSVLSKVAIEGKQEDCPGNKANIFLTDLTDLGIGATQAGELLTHAQALHDMKQRGESSLSDGMSQISNIAQRQDQIHHSVERLVLLQSMFSERIVAI